MKNILKTVLLATAGLFILGQANAQNTLGHKIDKGAKKVGHATAKTATTVGHATAKTATTVGHKTAEVAAKGDAAVVDKKYDGKVAPNGQAVYINNKAQYYYVDKKGRRVYVRKAELRDKR